MEKNYNPKMGHDFGDFCYWEILIKLIEESFYIIFWGEDTKKNHNLLKPILI